MIRAVEHVHVLKTTVPTASRTMLFNCAVSILEDEEIMMSNKIRGANMATYSVRLASEEVIALTSETGRREMRGKAKGLYVHGVQGVPLVPRKDKVTYGRWKAHGGATS